MKKEGDCGYLPNLQSSHHPDSLEYEETPTLVDRTKIEYVQRFINLCKENQIILVFIVSPRYTQVESNYYDPIKTVAKQNGIHFLDYHTTGLFHDHPEYFSDNSHLWDKGARVYSSIFAHDLKDILY